MDKELLLHDQSQQKIARKLDDGAYDYLLIFSRYAH